MKHIAIYSRVSTNQQDTASQDRELERWVASQGWHPPEKFNWYRDKATGRTMDRPEWKRLEAALLQRKVSAIVIWRLDRLGRTASGLTKLFDRLVNEGVNLISLKDSLDLSTPAGRLMANVLASVAQYETEVRAERVRAGIDRAKAEGKTWGGSKGGVRKKNKEKVAAAFDMLHQGKSVAHVSRVTGLSRQWIYKLLERNCEA